MQQQALTRLNAARHATTPVGGGPAFGLLLPLGDSTVAFLEAALNGRL